MSTLAGLDQLIDAVAPPAPTEPCPFYHSANFDRAVAEAGYLDIAREDGFGALDAALITERLARLPCVIEAAASSIVAPALAIPAGTRPLALGATDLRHASRFLPVAQVLLIERHDQALMIEVDQANVEPVETLMAYPYGRLKTREPLKTRVVGDGATLRRRWRIALAVEAAGCMAAGVAQVVEYVKTRQAFGRPLGAFQAVQHRLAMAAEIAESTKWLAWRAAWSDSEDDAALAAGFAQARIASLTYDLHQFCGAMGLTLEFPLHLWTYRLRALAGELGGASAQGRAAAIATWGS